MNNPKIVIMKRELKSYFTSPVAYIVTALFLLVSGFLLFSVFFLAKRAELRQFFSLLPLLFSLFIPALTMRLFSEELGRGTIETLMTLPVNAWDVVIGKFLSGLISALVLLAPTLIYAITASCFGDIDLGPVFCGYLGGVFLAASFTSIGLFSSSLTKNQIIAFFVAFAICIVLAMIDQFLVFLPSGIVNLLQYISAGSHFTSISRGIIDSRDLIYFLSVTALFLVLSVKVVQNRRAA